MARTIDESEALPDRLGARFPWELGNGIVDANKPAPPADYASRDAAPAERARFRGVKKVETHLAGESYPREAGGVLNQENFPEAAPR